MNRQDLLWLALKATGLYLIVDGLYYLPDTFAGAERVDYFDAYIPLAAGCLFLGLRVSGGTGTGEITIVGGMPREDWFWLICKALGLFWIGRILPTVPRLVELYLQDQTDFTSCVALMMHLALGLWLLLSDRLPRLVAARSAAAAPGPASTTPPP